MTSGLGRKVMVIVFLLAAGAYFLLVRETEVGTGLILGDARDPVRAEDGPETIQISGEEALEHESSEVETPAPRSITVQGRVVGANGEAIGGVVVERRHPYLVASSSVADAAGNFSLALDEPHGELAPADGAWMLLGGDRHLEEARLDGYTLVVAARASWSGTVGDTRGQPLADAMVRVLAPGDALVRFGIVATPVEHATQSAWSDKLGRFRIEAAPRIAGARIEATLSGYEPASLVLPDDPATPIELVLRARP